MGRKAKPMPLWTSRTKGLDEKAISRRVTASRTVKAMPRRRAVRLARRLVIGVDRRPGGSARRAGVRLGDEDAVHVVELLEDDARCRARRR